MSIYHERQLKRYENWTNNEPMKEHFVTIEPKCIAWKYVTNEKLVQIDQESKNIVTFKCRSSDVKPFAISNFVIKPDTGEHIIDLRYNHNFAKLSIDPSV